jgi:signal transduction histidine kinase
MVLEVQLNAAFAEKQLMMNRIYIIAAGVLAGLMAIGTFWYITTRIILSPVRVLRDVTQKVSEGDLNIRSDINTGDEFEQFSGVFNQMLENLKSNQEELRTVNKSLDLKLGELAETNVALYEANKIKGEFLANVSHELRTPLHSMIGFAEVLGETLQDRTGPVDEKRKRYVANIISSSRSLLHLITDLLDVAKIEAGRMDLTVSQMSVADTAEGLINLIRPQAGKRNIELRLKIDSNLPMVETDAGKFQQIIFNFLSNAIKFTSHGGRVELGAAPNTTPDQAEPSSVRIWVTDTGPGIPIEQQQTIFEKFQQIGDARTREHGGSGLGLAISRELAQLLQGRIELDSDIGRGATFSLIIPVTMEPTVQALMPEASD